MERRIRIPSAVRQRYGVTYHRRADPVQCARRHRLQISDRPQEDAGKDADAKDIGAFAKRSFLMHDRIRVSREKHIYNDNRIGYRELPRHGSALARRGQIQNGAVGHGQVLYKRRENSVAHSHRVPLARGAHSLPRYNPRRSAHKRQNIRKRRLDTPGQERVVVFYRRRAQPPL